MLREKGLAHGFGGGIYVNGGSLTMTNATVFRNYAILDGGGLHLTNAATVDIINSTITDNLADSDNFGAAFTGGGIDVSSDVTLNLIIC